ncbi:MAG TPA: 4-hydroxybutyrate CoA transferase [Dehalococcoidia bacterium]|nr:4-hydroxybutyrate CoA transferase [Dehalococcoidia bacterium]
MNQWQDDYSKKLVTAEEAVKAIKSGDRVAFAYGIEPLAVGLALAARKDELSGVQVLVPAPGRDFPWYEPGWEDSFHIEIGHVLPIVQQMITQRRGDYLVSSLFWAHPPAVREPVDVFLVQLSPPNDKGYCSFGASLWNKKVMLQAARTVIAEVNKNLIRTYGDNFIHVSEIDYFVEHTPTGRLPGATDLLGRKTTGPGEVEKQIAQQVEKLINDGDTLEIGVGGTSEWIPLLGVLDNKVDLGWHSENTPRGIATLVKNGVITGTRKTINTGKAIATAVGGGTKEEMDFINMNPLFELWGSDYVLDPRIISAHDNMVAINSAIAIDLTGQINAESLGPTMVSGTGGQLAFATGVALSKGGKNITVLPSTARGGTLSRIVPSLEGGSIVSVPRTLADIVVTEYGVARLCGKTQRQRAEELISIAHPDFRSELRREAKRLFWP